MLDRLISGAGAVTDAADRAARSVARPVSGATARTRPGSAAVAAILLILAAILALAGFEATDGTTPVQLAPAAVADAADLADRTYATMHGSIHGAYVETFYDDNENAVQDAGEHAVAWYYWLLDPTARSGVTVRSIRPPSEVYTYRASGIVVDDAEYVATVLADMGSEVASLGLDIDKTHVIDATDTVVGSTSRLDLAASPPAAGAAVVVSGPRLGTYVWDCESDGNGDGLCDESEAVAFDIIVFDPVSKHAISVRVPDPPEFTDATLTGLLRRDERAVDDARTTEGLAFDGLGLNVSSRYVLDDQAAPGSAPLAFGLATLLTLVAGTILIGLAGGYLIYRRSSGGLPAAATTLDPGERIALRITGDIRTPTGRIHVREVPGALVRFVLRPASNDVPASTTLLIERDGRPEGVALGLGETRRLSSGAAQTLRWPRPALRVVAGTGPLVLSFDTEAERDRAAAEVLDETGLGPDGTNVGTS